MLHKYKKLFSCKVQIAKIREHKIRLLPDLERKRPFIYRIPESIKALVGNQVEELLRLGLIKESEAATAHPVVCVYK